VERRRVLRVDQGEESLRAGQDVALRQAADRRAAGAGEVKAQLAGGGVTQAEDEAGQRVDQRQRLQRRRRGDCRGSSRRSMAGCGRVHHKPVLRVGRQKILTEKQEVSDATTQGALIDRAQGKFDNFAH